MKKSALVLVFFAILSVFLPSICTAFPMLNDNLSGAAKKSEVVIKGQVTSVEHIGKGTYILDARNIKFLFPLDKYKATVKVLRKIKGDVGDTVDVGFFADTQFSYQWKGLSRNFPTAIKDGQTLILCLSNVDGMLMGTDYQNWQYPASSAIVNATSSDMNSALNEEMLILIDDPEADMDTRLIAYRQLTGPDSRKTGLLKMRPFLQDKDQIVRFEAAGALLRIGDIDSFPVIRKVLEEPFESNDRLLLNVYNRALYQISTHPTKPYNLTVVKSLLESDKKELRDRAATCLADEQTRPLLIDALKSEKKETRFSILHALAWQSKDYFGLQPKPDMSAEDEARLIEYWRAQLQPTAPLIKNGSIEESSVSKEGK